MKNLPYSGGVGKARRGKGPRTAAQRRDLRARTAMIRAADRLPIPKRRLGGEDA